MKGGNRKRLGSVKRRKKEGVACGGFISNKNISKSWFFSTSYPSGEVELEGRVKLDGVRKGALAALSEGGIEVKGLSSLGGRDESAAKPAIGHDVVHEERSEVSHVDPVLVVARGEDGASLDVALHGTLKLGRERR